MFVLSHVLFERGYELNFKICLGLLGADSVYLGLGLATTERTNGFKEKLASHTHMGSPGLA